MEYGGMMAEIFGLSCKCLEDALRAVVYSALKNPTLGIDLESTL